VPLKSIVFLVALNGIWHGHNQMVFQSKVFLGTDVVSYVMRIAIGVTRSGISNLQVENPASMRVRWLNRKAPPVGWVKANIDGSVRDNGCQASCAEVLRNSYSELITRFMCNLGSTNVLMAELWGLHLSSRLHRTLVFRN